MFSRYIWCVGFHSRCVIRFLSNNACLVVEPLTCELWSITVSHVLKIVVGFLGDAYKDEGVDFLGNRSLLTGFCIFYLPYSCVSNPKWTDNSSTWEHSKYPLTKHSLKLKKSKKSIKEGIGCCESSCQSNNDLNRIATPSKVWYFLPNNSREAFLHEY